MAGVKRAAKAHPNEPPARLLATSVGVLGEEVAQMMPERRTLKRQVNRWQNEERPPLPGDLRNIVIVPPYDKNAKNERFLLYDSGVEDEDRLLIFASDWAIEKLCHCDMMFCDGTFKTVPEQFAQLFTIHGKYRNFVFPFVFCLTTRLDENTYHRVYDVLKEKAVELGLQLAPKKIMMDFELGNINAARAAFPRAEVHLCLFHFTKSLWRHVQLLGLRREYEILESDIRKQITALKALPFLPLDDLADAFEEVTEGMDQRLDELISYLETTYVLGSQRRRRRLPPRFAPALWNVYQLALDGEQRTNNAAEGWHNHFQKMMIVHHASIWRFLDVLKLEEKNIRTQVDQLRGGHTQLRDPLNKRYQTNQRQVESIVAQYAQYKDEGDVLGYLRSIGYQLKSGPAAAEPAEPAEPDESQ